MGERIPEEKLNEIRQATDIVDLISDYVQLKKQGRNYFGLCPFHGENTPSFSVSPEKQIYHCFGCGAGGNVFSFLMDYEGLTFHEAAFKLASRANIELEMPSSVFSYDATKSKEKQELLSAHDLLRKFYHHLLVNTKEGQPALDYLYERGFTPDSIEKFQIGCAPNSRDFVLKFLTKRNFSLQSLEKAGLIIRSERDGTYFDRFRGRIMFPIFDHKGNTIAFSGRILGSGEPKYLNSPETPIFNKSKVLYNFHLAKPMMRKKQQVVLFEGFADCIAADRAGVENGVATMGTSLTEDHAAIIRRTVPSVIVCYDSDHAGVEAALRAGNLLTESGCQVQIARMPDGLDPDEYVKKFGENNFKKEVVDSSITFMSFKLLYLKQGKNLQYEGDRLKYIEEAVREISALDKAVEKDYYLRQLAEEFSLSLEALKEEVRQVSDSMRKMKRDKRTRNHSIKNHVSIQQVESLKPAFHNAERRLIFYMLRDPNIAFKVQDMLQGNTFNIDEHQAIITYLYGYYERGFEPDASQFINYLDDEKLKRIVANIEMMSINEEPSDEEISDYIKQVLNQQKMLKIKEKEAEGKEAERRKDFERAASIAMEIIQLRKSLT